MYLWTSIKNLHPPPPAVGSIEFLFLLCSKSIELFAQKNPKYVTAKHANFKVIGTNNILTSLKIGADINFERYRSCSLAMSLFQACHLQSFPSYDILLSLYVALLVNIYSFHCVDYLLCRVSSRCKHLQENIQRSIKYVVELVLRHCTSY